MSEEQALKELGIMVMRQHDELLEKMEFSLKDAEIPEQYHAILKTMMYEMVGHARIQDEEMRNFTKKKVQELHEKQEDLRAG
jgi:hypothetical protein